MIKYSRLMRHKQQGHPDNEAIHKAWRTMSYVENEIYILRSFVETFGPKLDHVGEVGLPPPGTKVI